MSAAANQEPIVVLIGSAEVLTGSAVFLDSCARSLAGLGEQFPPRLRRFAEDAIETSKVLRVISRRLQEAGSGGQPGGTG